MITSSKERKEAAQSTGDGAPGKKLLSPTLIKVLGGLIPILTGAIIWFSPTPAGLQTQAWRMLAIFVATILGLLFQPLPSGALMFLVLSFSIISGVLTESKALIGFTNSTVWLIFCAYVISIGFLRTGLGRRIAYKMIQWLGGSTLGIAYALGFSDLILAPAMPSVTARSGGVIFPILRSLNEICGSEPGPTGKKLGNFLVISCFLITPVTGSMFLTGMAADPLAAELAKKTLKINITWSGWAMAAVVPGLICFMVTPLLLYWLTKPTMKRAPGAHACSILLNGLCCVTSLLLLWTPNWILCASTFWAQTGNAASNTLASIRDMIRKDRSLCEALAAHYLLPRTISEQTNPAMFANFLS
jgi:di/tricarboxylate transporter